MLSVNVWITDIGRDEGFVDEGFDDGGVDTDRPESANVGETLTKRDPLTRAYSTPPTSGSVGKFVEVGES